MEEIILKHLNRENLSREEEAKLERWLTFDQKNARIFNQLKLNLMGATPDQMEEMKGEVWGQLQGKIQQPEPEKSTHNILLSHWQKIAAIFIVTLGIGSYIYLDKMDVFIENQQGIVLVEKESQYGQKLTFTLPDGSTVKLNAGSKVTFPKEFDPDSREINLIGEAFFDITRDESRPFRIRTENLNVEVLGTSFNVKAYPDDPEVSVAVKSGRVRVDLLRDDGYYILDPQEMVAYSTSKRTAEKRVFEDSQLAFGWTDKQLVYKNANIAQIMKDLSRWYGVEFKMDKVLDHEKKISGRYDNPSLVDVMKSLSFAYDFDFKIDDKKIIIE